MRPLLLPPVVGLSETRQIDDFGSGGFGAPRDGGVRSHNGLDFRGSPGSEIQFPFDATISPDTGLAYEDSITPFRSIHLLGVGAFDGLKAKLLYVEPLVADGMTGKAGALLGTLQNIAGYYQCPHAPRKRMQNHTHFELYELVAGIWVLRNPAQFLKV